MLLWYIGITAPREKGIRMMLYRFEVDYTVPGKMGSKNYVTAVAATDAAHEANFHEVPDDDITQVDAKDIPDHDILVGGFPCQPFSIAGVSKKNSLGRKTGFEDETQGTLFFDVCRILAEKRPKAFFLENVKNLTSHDKGNTFRVIQDAVDGIGYDLFYQVLDAQDYVPQHRERIVLIGFNRDFYDGRATFDFELPKPKIKPCLADILDVDVPEKYTLTDNLWAYLQAYAAKHKAAGKCDTFKELTSSGGLSDPGDKRMFG